MRDGDEARLGLLAHLTQEIAEALDIGIVERRVDFVQHADRRRVGQEYREDQRQRGQRLLAAREKRHRLRLLAGRARHDVEAGLERILGFDELQFRRAAAEQQREQLLETRVDLLERGKQALAPLFVEIADRGAQLLDRFVEIVALGDHAIARGFDLLQLLVGAQIDRAEALALALLGLEFLLDGGGIRQLRAGFYAGERDEIVRRAIEFERDRVQMLRQALARRLKPRFAARLRFARAAHRLERGTGLAVGIGERGLACRERIGGGLARRLRV